MPYLISCHKPKWASYGKPGIDFSAPYCFGIPQCLSLANLWLKHNASGEGKGGFLSIVSTSTESHKRERAGDKGGQTVRSSRILESPKKEEVGGRGSGDKLPTRPSDPISETVSSDFHFLWQQWGSLSNHAIGWRRVQRLR